MAGDSLSRSEIDGKLQKLETKLDNLRRDYEQFFVGARDRPPRNTRKQVDKLVRDLEQASVTNTSQKFRLRGLVQRYNSYKQKWNRVERQIEEGTYAPHQERAKRRAGERTDDDQPNDRKDGGDQQEDDVVELDVDMEGVDLDDLERELQEMDEAGEFDRFDETERMTDEDFDRAERRQRRRREQDDDQSRRRPPQGADQPAASAERPGGGNDDAPNWNRDADPDKLRELQDKLGLSSGSGKSSGQSSGEDKRQKLKSMRQKLGGDGGAGDGGNRQPPNHRNHSGPKRRDEPRRSDSPDGDRQAPRSDSGSQKRRDRVIERSSNRRRSSRDSSSDEDSDDDDDTHAEWLYERLLETKRETGESTDHLTFEAVRESMHRQIDRLVEERDCRDADFRVVVKDDRVFLQPVPIE